MKLLATAVGAAVLAAAVLPAQIPVYSSNEDYCARNPMAPTCKDGKPLDMHIVAPQSDEWCEKYPATMGCRDGHYVGTAKPKAVTTRTVAPAPYVAPSSASSVTP